VSSLVFVAAILTVGFVLGFAVRSYMSYRRRQRARQHRVDALPVNELPPFVNRRTAGQTDN